MRDTEGRRGGRGGWGGGGRGGGGGVTWCGERKRRKKPVSSCHHPERSSAPEPSTHLSLLTLQLTSAEHVITWTRANQHRVQTPSPSTGATMHTFVHEVDLTTSHSLINHRHHHQPSAFVSLRQTSVVCHSPTRHLTATLRSHESSERRMIQILYLLQITNRHTVFEVQDV